MDRTRTLIAVSGLLQILFMVIGFCALGIVMKMNGYPDEFMIRWTPLARGLREYGVYVLVIPVTWIVYTIVAAQIERGLFSLDVAVAVGFLLAFLILFVFLYATFNSYTRPLLIHVAPY